MTDENEVVGPTHGDPVEKVDAKESCELAVGSLDERLRQEDDARYEYLLPTIRQGQKLGIPDRRLEARYNIKLRPEHRAQDILSSRKKPVAAY